MAAVVARIAAEVSGPLTAALNRVVSLAASGHIDRAGLQSLRDEIDDARQAGVRGQQIARFAEGPLQQSVERIDLSRLLRDLLTAQAMQACAAALGRRQTLGAAEVMGDLSLLHAVLQAAVGRRRLAHAVRPPGRPSLGHGLDRDRAQRPRLRDRRHQRPSRHPPGR